MAILNEELKNANCVKHKKITRVYNGAVWHVSILLLSYYHNNYYVLFRRHLFHGWFACLFFLVPKRSQMFSHLLDFFEERWLKTIKQ